MAKKTTSKARKTTKAKAKVEDAEILSETLPDAVLDSPVEASKETPEEIFAENTPDGTPNDAAPDIGEASVTTAEDTPDADPVANDPPAEEPPLGDEPAQNPTQTEAQRRRGLPVVAGGALAALLGFGAAQVVPDGWPVTPDPTVTNALAAENSRIETRIEEASAHSAAELAALRDGDLAALTQSLADLQGALSTLDGRISALEDRPVVDLSTLDGAPAIEAELEKLRLDTANATQAAESDIQAELAALREELSAVSANAQAEIQAARDEATLLEQNALDAAQSAAKRAALTQVLAGLDSGEPYADTLAELQKLSDAEVPAALVAGAEDGVATLAALQSDFAPLARSALTAMRRADDSGQNTLSNFFQTQLGVRSLEAQEGTTPDAILSRVEAATTQGRLSDALAEIDTLPEVGKAILAPWTEAAQSRLAAFEAAQTLTQSLTLN